MIHVSAVNFQRTRRSPIESGISINEGQIIIDAAGLVVPAPIWDYHSRDDRGVALFLTRQEINQLSGETAQ